MARCLTGLDDGTYGTRLAESILPPDEPYDILTSCFAGVRAHPLIQCTSRDPLESNWMQQATQRAECHLAKDYSLFSASW